MIELTEQQRQALDGPEQPVTAVDPATGREYLLVRRDVYDRMRAFLKPLARGWDNPADDDLTRQPS
jgi:hypothetical protein